MSHVQRYRSGRVSEVRVLIDAGDVVEVGDLVSQVGNYVKDFTLQGAGTTGFVAEFLGVLVQGGTSGNETEDTPGLVYDSGEFEYPLDTAAAAYAPAGTIVAAVGPQVVTLTDVVVAEAVGRLAKPANVGDTTVLVRIDSNEMRPLSAES